MPLVIRDVNTIPPERFHYLVSATNFDIYAPNYNGLYSAIQQHCIANNVGIPSLQEVIDFCCANLSVPCYNSDDRTPLVNRWVMGTPGKLPSSCCSSAKAAPAQIEGL